MDHTRKYLTLTCKVCGVEYLQQERVFRKLTVNQNRCRSHRIIKRYKRSRPKKIYTCVDCNTSVCRNSTRCKTCSGKHRSFLNHDKKCKCGNNIKPKSTNCLSCHNIAQDRGLSKERVKFQNSKEWKEVRKKVFDRDNYTCQMCNRRGGINLQAHHIKSYISREDLRLELSNLITYCISCHRKWHKEHGRA